MLTRTFGVVLLALASWPLVPRNPAIVESSGGGAAGPDAGPVLWHEAKALLPTRMFHPPEFDPERAHTLIVGFHGFGSSAEAFGPIAEALAEKGFLVALPECGYALLVGGTLGFDWFLNNAQGEELGDRSGRLLMFDHMPTMLTDLEGRYSIDRVYTLGFSQGAVAAMGTAIFNHERFAGAVFVGLPEFSTDWLPGESLPEGKNVRLLFLHGEQDTVVPFTISETAHAVFSDAGYDTSLHPFAGGHTVPRDGLEHVVDWIRQ